MGFSLRGCELSIPYVRFEGTIASGTTFLCQGYEQMRLNYHLPFAIKPYTMKTRKPMEAL
jgi:hypothetical protein